MKDKEGTFLKPGDRITDSKGVEWKIENIRGVSLVCRYENGKMLESKPYRKIDFSNMLKVV